MNEQRGGREQNPIGAENKSTNIHNYSSVRVCGIPHLTLNLQTPIDDSTVQVGWQNNGQHSIRLVTCVDWNGTHPKVCCSQVELSSGCHLWVSRYCYIGPKLTSLSLPQPNSRSVNALPTLLLLYLNCCCYTAIRNSIQPIHSLTDCVSSCRSI